MVASQAKCNKSRFEVGRISAVELNDNALTSNI